MMETVYYSTAESSSYPLAQVPLRETLKRKMTLELNNSDRKKSKYASLQTPIFQNEVLASPDLQMCKLASPDLENLIHNMPLNTPNIFFAKSVTDPNGSGGVDGDQYDTTGFDDALNSLRKQNQLQTTGTTTPQYTSLPQIQSIGVVSTTTTNSSISNNNNNNYYAPSQSGESINSEDSMMSETSSAYGYPGSVGDISNVSSTNTKIKHESSGNSAPISPVDMESQERIKLERKRQRNRLAASKCRKRKLEKISNLEDRVNRLKKENNELSKVLERLQESVGDLKDKVMKHVQSGCQIMIAQTPPF